MNSSRYIVSHPMSHTFEFWQQRRPKFTPVQSGKRAEFIAKFWANKYRKPVYVYCGKWGYFTVNPDSGVQS